MNNIKKVAIRHKLAYNSHSAVLRMDYTDYRACPEIGRLFLWGK